jgi:DNA-binding transcriptional ArsR family regulator
MATGEAKAALFDGMASVAQALGSGRRAEIVDVLAQGERSVEEIAGEISQSVANTSQHLRVLARAGLVRSRRDGTRVIYRLASDQVAELWASVRDVAMRHLAEVSVLADEYLGDRDGVEHLSADELTQRLSSTCDPNASTQPDTSPAPARSRSTDLARRSRSCRGDARLSRIAGVRTACTPMTPCGYCGSVD